MVNKVSKKKVLTKKVKNSKINNSIKEKSLSKSNKKVDNKSDKKFNKRVDNKSDKKVDEELIVSKEEILNEEKLAREKEVKKSKKDKQKEEEDSQPSWYHYAIIFIVLGGIFGVMYFGFEYYSSISEDKNKSKLLIDLYDYPYVVGNTTYNIKFHYPIDELERANYVIEPDKYDILNTLNITRVFKEYNGTDNGKVIISASKLYSFINKVYHVDFTDSARFNVTSCDNSTMNSKVMVFDIYANRTGVFFNEENGCIEVMSQIPEDLVLVSDKFIYEMIKNN